LDVSNYNYCPTKASNCSTISLGLNLLRARQKKHADDDNGKIAGIHLNTILLIQHPHKPGVPVLKTQRERRVGFRVSGNQVKYPKRKIALTDEVYLIAYYRTPDI
jgi:hypothetical protein